MTLLKNKFSLRIILFAASFLLTSIKLSAQDNKDDNNKCLGCHSKSFIELPDSVTGNMVKFTFPSNCVIDTNIFYNSNHKTLTCTRCHSDDFQTLPHPKDLKNKVMPACIDCHGGDNEKYKKFHFDNIDSAFLKSVHFSILKEKFSCNNCHNQHYFKVTASVSDDISKTVAYDNLICTRCHDNAERYSNTI